MAEMDSRSQDTHVSDTPEASSRPGATKTTATPLTAALPDGLVARLAGAIVTGSHRQTYTLYAPFTGEPIGELPQSAPGDVQLAFEKARKAQAAWAARPVQERTAVLLRAHDLVLQRQAEILDIIQIENGKARLHAFEEIAELAQVCRYYARTAKSHLKPRRRAGVFPIATKTYEIRHPKGVVGIISPWNYPLALGAADAVPAFAAGNAVVSMPDMQTPLTALWARELFIEAGLPADLWQVVVGEGPVIGPSVVDHADYVSFTGSTRTGRQVAQQAAYGLVGCSLELGGKNPMIVLEDADLDKAVEGAIRGCFASAGQLCVSIERLYVHHAVYQEFLERFVKRTRSLRLGAALDFSADIGSLTSKRQLETVRRHVEDARAKGAKVVAGGIARPDIGPYFFEPTILTGVHRDMLVYAEETFGPVVSVYPVKSAEDAILKANDTKYGLNASVWTRDIRRARALAERIKAGTVNVNEAYAAAYGSVDAPMGGMGDSGLGRRHGAEGILKFTEVQNVAIQRFVPFAPAFGLDARRWTRLLTTSLSLMKKLGKK